MMRPGCFAFDQAARDPLRKHHRRGQIGRQRGVPGRARQQLGASGRRDSRVVDEDIDVAEFAVHGRDQAIEIGVGGDIGLHTDGLDAVGFGEFCGANVSSRSPRRAAMATSAPASASASRAFDAQSRRRAGDQTDMALQREEFVQRIHPGCIARKSSVAEGFARRFGRGRDRAIDIAARNPIMRHGAK